MTMWELEKKIRNDPRRKPLTWRRSFGSGNIVFHEMTPAGLFSLEIINEGKALYLPEFSCANCGRDFHVLLERKVIEPGASCYGVGTAGSVRGLSRLKLRFKAANLTAKNISVEVPNWSY